VSLILVNDTSGKFTTGDFDTGVVHLDFGISPRIKKKIRIDPNVIPQGLGRR
jgi:hypothetical protein